MLLRRPAYFDQFRCIAAACTDSCCKEWDVLVDEESAARYLAMDGQLGNDLRTLLQRDEDGDWYFPIIDGRCPMWRKDGLCRIQAECDHDTLCQTCRDFPRLRHDYGSFTEQGLALSCPEAARLIFCADDAWLEQEVPGGEEPEYDPADMSLLLQSRKQMLQLLSDTTRPLPETLALALLYGYRVQDALDGGSLDSFDADAELAFARSIAKPGDPTALRQFYLQLEILTDTWRKRLLSPAPEPRWDPRLLPFARYSVSRYYLQAVSDLDLVSRVKMIIAACLLLRLLGGDTEQTAQLYAKEIENDADNIDAILDGAYTSPALTDDKLLGLLLL